MVIIWPDILTIICTVSTVIAAKKAMRSTSTTVDSTRAAARGR